MILPETGWRTRADLIRLTEALGAHEGLVRYVGGAVRDALLGHPLSDLDLATALLPDEVSRRVKAAGYKAVPTGIAHGTITAVLPSGPVEVTTLRRDVSTDGRRATVAFTDDWREDAARRDFTINALSVAPGNLEIFDYFDGLADLEAHRVRFIGDALTRIAEDHLRILRFFRFHARFGEGDPDPEGLAACAARANDLMALSRERIADEMLKLLGLDDPSATVALMRDRGILAPVLPEIGAAGVSALAALPPRERAAGVAPDGVRRLGALLPPDPEVAEGVARRLRLSNAARQRLACIAARGETAPADPPALAYRTGLACAIDRLLLDEKLDDPAVAAAVSRLDGWQKPRLPVTGGMLIARGLEAGPVVARTLQAIEAEWIAAGFPEGGDFGAIVERQLVQALRSSQ